jgi:hypothetical protein
MSKGQGKGNAPQSIAERLYPHLIKQAPQPPKALSEADWNWRVSDPSSKTTMLAAYGLIAKEAER